MSEKVEAARKQFTEEKQIMEGFLQVKIQKNLQLEVLLDEMKDAYRVLEKEMSSDDRQLRQKVHMQERSLDQIQ